MIYSRWKPVVRRLGLKIGSKQQSYILYFILFIYFAKRTAELHRLNRAKKLSYMIDRNRGQVLWSLCLFLALIFIALVWSVTRLSNVKVEATTNTMNYKLVFESTMSSQTTHHYCRRRTGRTYRSRSSLLSFWRRLHGVQHMCFVHAWIMCLVWAVS
jgi:hypothetical protein